MSAPVQDDGEPGPRVEWHALPEHPTYYVRVREISDEEKTAWVREERKARREDWCDWMEERYAVFFLGSLDALFIGGLMQEHPSASTLQMVPLVGVPLGIGLAVLGVAGWWQTWR